MNPSLFYLFHPDGEKFLLDYSTGSDMHCKPVRMDQILGSVFTPEAAFLLACQVLHQEIPSNRETIELLLQKHSRNILLKNVRCEKRLVKANVDYLQEKGLDMKHAKAFSSILALAMAPIKGELGIPVKDPADHFYEIDTVVVAAAKDPALRKYLEQKAVQGPVYAGEMDSIWKEIDERWPDESVSVLAALEETKTRDVISLFDIKEVEGQRVVQIVNGSGELLQFEDWRLPALVEKHDEQIKLGEFPRYNERGEGNCLKFNDCHTGTVLGMYEAKMSRLHVMHLDNKKPPLEKRTEFILDQDFLMCMYVVIKGLREDKEEYQRLKEKALVETGDHPFTKFHR